MPTLHWIGKEQVLNHHRDVPFKVLEQQYGFDGGSTQTREATASGNKIIHGDNLEALKALLPEYEGKVKCIYIDPPYNTGNEGWIYNDNVNDPKIKKWLGAVVGKESEDLSRHDKWLCMMYPRLKLLHKLLADDGAIFISIDDNEQANLKLIMDEIFGGGNFINNVIWEKKYTVANDAKYLSDNHDFIVGYAKNKSSLKVGRLPRTEEMNDAYKNPDNHPKGKWKATPIHAKSGSDSNFRHIFPNGYEWTPPKGTYPRFSRETLDKLFANNEIWFGSDGKNSPSKKTFLSELKFEGLVSRTLWRYDEVGHNHEAKKEIQILGLGEIFHTPKPKRLIERILQIATDSNSLILDSFAGSGTTAHAVLNLNKQDGGARKFILIEMEPYAESITAERVKRVITGYGGTEGMGGAFDFYEMGAPLFGEDGNLNESVGAEHIREYVYYTETRTPLPKRDSSHQETPAFLGKHGETAYYFHYEAGAITTLNHAFLAHVRTKAEEYVIYADNCLLPPEALAERKIIFKKIPRDMARF